MIALLLALLIAPIPAEIPAPAPAATIAPAVLVPPQDAFPLVSDDVALTNPASLLPVPKTHKFFMARWQAKDYANALIGVEGSLDSCQTSCRGGFLNGKCIPTGGGCFQPAEANHFSKPCTGKNQWLKNEMCTVGLVGFKIGIEQTVGRHWSQSDNNFDAGITTAFAGVYYSSTIKPNGVILDAQNQCTGIWFPGDGGKCFHPFGSAGMRK